MTVLFSFQISSGTVRIVSIAKFLFLYNPLSSEEYKQMGYLCLHSLTTVRAGSRNQTFGHRHYLKIITSVCNISGKQTRKYKYYQSIFVYKILLNLQAHYWRVGLFGACCLKGYLSWRFSHCDI